MAIVLVIVGVAVGGVFGVVVLVYPLAHREEIRAAAVRFDVDADLIASVIHAESRFREGQVSHRGAVGLMQIMPATAVFIGDKIGIANADEVLDIPSFNITLGTAYLRYLLDKFGDLETALFAYNAGEGKVAKWMATDDFGRMEDGRRVLVRSPYPGANEYVRRVMGNRRFYSWRI